MVRKNPRQTNPQTPVMMRMQNLPRKGPRKTMMMSVRSQEEEEVEVGRAKEVDRVREEEAEVMDEIGEGVDVQREAEVE